jgi:hypothetical protein
MGYTISYTMFQIHSPHTNTNPRRGEGGSPRLGTREGKASRDACIGCSGALFEWHRGGGQWLRETAGWQREDHGPTLERARPAVEATVTAGDVNGGWAGGTGATWVSDLGGVRERWHARLGDGSSGGGRRHRGTLVGRQL